MPDQLTALVGAASDIASLYLGYASVDGEPPTIARQSVSEQIHIDPHPHRYYHRRLSLSLRPVKVESVMFGDENIPLADLFIQTEGVITFLKSGYGAYGYKFPVNTPITVVYDAGYVTSDQAGLTPVPEGPRLPLSIEQAVLSIAQQSYSTQSRDDFGLIMDGETHDEVGNLTRRWADSSKTGSVPGEAASLLGPYKILC